MSRISKTEIICKAVIAVVFGLCGFSLIMAGHSIFGFLFGLAAVGAATS